LCCLVDVLGFHGRSRKSCCITFCDTSVSELVQPLKCRRQPAWFMAGMFLGLPNGTVFHDFLEIVEIVSGLHPPGGNVMSVQQLFYIPARQGRARYKAASRSSRTKLSMRTVHCWSWNRNLSTRTAKWTVNESIESRSAMRGALPHV